MTQTPSLRQYGLTKTVLGLPVALLTSPWQEPFWAQTGGSGLAVVTGVDAVVVGDVVVLGDVVTGLDIVVGDVATGVGVVIVGDEVVTVRVAAGGSAGRSTYTT